MPGSKTFVTSLYTEITEKKLTLIAAGIAFYGLLALFPGIGALMAVSGIVADPQEVTQMMESLDGVLPEAASEIILGQAREVAGQGTDGLGVLAIVGVLLALYSASKGMQALMDGLNIVTGRKDDRGFVKQTLLKLALTAGLILGVLACIAVAAVVPAVLAWLPLGSGVEETLIVARWPVLLAIAALGIALTYRVGPAGEHMAWHLILPGAALACVLWLAGTAAFAIYVRLSGSYQETFGALGGVVVLLMWLWVSASVVLVGALVSKLMRESSKAD